MKVSWQEYALGAVTVGLLVWGLESAFDAIGGSHSSYANFGFGWWAAGGVWLSRWFYIV
jgi:hypothetical protein